MFFFYAFFFFCFQAVSLPSVRLPTCNHRHQDLGFAGGAAMVGRLHKQVRELAHGYYLSQARRVKKWEKSLNQKGTQQALLVRYCFKVCVGLEMGYLFIQRDSCSPC